jgi:hypothetical protein
MKLLFEDRYGRYREIAEVADKNEAAIAIKDFLDAHNFKSYYTRSWIREKEVGYQVMYDVGSHSEFFCVPFETYEEANAFLKEGL